MGTTPSVVLEEGRVRAGITVEELWMRYFALGGMSDVAEVRAFLKGAPQPDAKDYELLSQALNEMLSDLHFDRTVPYSRPAGE